MDNSDGISLADKGKMKYPHGHCAGFEGVAWMRWAVVRNNRISGISDASRLVGKINLTKPNCGAVRVQGPRDVGVISTDIVVEGNAMSCPAAGFLPSGGIEVV